MLQMMDSSADGYEAVLRENTQEKASNIICNICKNPTSRYDPQDGDLV